MPNAVVFVSFQLKKGVSVPDFVRTAEKLNYEYMAKQKGYLSWKQLVDGQTWVDLITFETMDDAQKVALPYGVNDFAEKFCSFIELGSCKSRLFSVERNY